MIEQSYPAGILYFSQIMTDEKGKKRLISDKVSVKDLKFLSAIKVRVWFNSRHPGSFYLQTAKDKFRYYRRDQFVKDVAILPKGLTPNNFCYGQCFYRGTKQSYWLKDEIKKRKKPDLDQIILPAFLTGYQYDMIFSYPQKLIDFIGDLDASFVDYFKRPLNLAGLAQKRYFPASLKNSHDHFKNLAVQDRHFPIVINLNHKKQDPPLAVMDLEPRYTKEDLALAESFDYYYVEETARGGRHYLVKPTKTDVFKWRLTPNLEVQVKTMVTLYGIFGKWVNDHPKPADFSQFTEVGRSKTQVPQKVDYSKAENLAKHMVQSYHIKFDFDVIKRNYQSRDDLSAADYWACADVYNKLADYLHNIDRVYAPWVIAAITRKIIPYRLKHDESRDGVPYLVYVAGKVLTNIGFVYY